MQCHPLHNRPLTPLTDNLTLALQSYRSWGSPHKSLQLKVNQSRELQPIQLNACIRDEGMRHNMYTQSKHPKQQTTSQFYKSSLGMGVFSQHKKLLAARTPRPPWGAPFQPLPLSYQAAATTDMPAASPASQPALVVCLPLSAVPVPSVRQCISASPAVAAAAELSAPPCLPASQLPPGFRRRWTPCCAPCGAAAAAACLQLPLQLRSMLLHPAHQRRHLLLLLPVGWLMPVLAAAAGAMGRRQRATGAAPWHLQEVGLQEKREG
jgi:hypothetical protein